MVQFTAFRWTLCARSPMKRSQRFKIPNTFFHFGNPVNELKADQLLKNELGIFSWRVTNRQKNPVKLSHYALWICEQGYCQILVGQHQFKISKSNIGIFSPNQVIKILSYSENFESEMICFTESFLKNCLIESTLFDQLLLINPDYPPVYELTTNDYQKVTQRFQEIENEYSEKRPFHLNLIRFLIVQLLYDYNRACEMCLLSFRKSINRQYQIVYEFKKLVEANFLKTKTVSEYSHQLHLSPKHLSDCTKKETGLSALEIIHERIFIEAEYLLLHTNQSIKEISDYLNFDTSSHFSRFFKSKCSMTPSNFRVNRKIGSSFRSS